MSFNSLNNYFPQVGCRCSRPKNYNPFLTEHEQNRGMPATTTRTPPQAGDPEGRQCHVQRLCPSQNCEERAQRVLLGLPGCPGRLAGESLHEDGAGWLLMGWSLTLPPPPLSAWRVHTHTDIKHTHTVREDTSGHLHDEIHMDPQSQTHVSMHTCTIHTPKPPETDVHVPRHPKPSHPNIPLP